MKSWLAENSAVVMVGLLLVAVLVVLGIWGIPREPTPIYLDTREFSIAGGGVQYVVSYLRGDEVVEVPTYSPEARDRVIERLTR
jgi:hypothetical protein